VKVTVGGIVAVFDGVDVCVGVLVGVNVGVDVLDGVRVAVGVFVGVKVKVGVLVGVKEGVDVLDGVKVAVVVLVGVFDGVKVNVGVLVGVSVGVKVLDGVKVGVVVLEGVGVWEGLWVAVTVPPKMFCGLQLASDTLKAVMPSGDSIKAPSSGETRSIVCDCPGSRKVCRHVSVPRRHSMISVTPLTAVTSHPSAHEPM